MRIVTGTYLLALMTNVAGAEVIANDPDDPPEPPPAIHPVKRLSGALYFSGIGAVTNGVNVVGLGPSAEVALGFGRTQLFVEGGGYHASASVGTAAMGGIMVRGGVGARWIARAFGIADEGGIELVFDGLVGAEKIWWETGDELVRPEVAGGVGLQVRKYARPSFAVRFSLRVYFAPTDDAIRVPASSMAARCAGACAAPPAHASGGIMFAIGGGL